MVNDFRNHRAVRGALLLGSFTLSILTTGCGASSAARRPDMRELDERRAVLVIQQSIQDHGERPGAGQDVTMTTGEPLHIDVMVAGTPYGVAFVTEQEAARLGSALPPRRRADELRLIRPEQNVVLLLYQDGYQYDVADTHAATAVTAENKLSKDVADFVLRVVRAGKTR